MLLLRVRDDKLINSKGNIRLNFIAVAQILPTPRR